jgi:hypothetical protein
MPQAFNHPAAATVYSARSTLLRKHPERLGLRLGAVYGQGIAAPSS